MAAFCDNCSYWFGQDYFCFNYFSFNTFFWCCCCVAVVVVDVAVVGCTFAELKSRRALEGKT